MTPIWLLLLVAATAAGQAVPPPRLLSAAEFAAAPKADKRETLNALASHRYSPSPPDEVADVIGAGLLDADEDVRLSAVYAVAGRAAGARFGLDKRFLDTWGAERPRLLRLRPVVFKTLWDANSRIRQAAIIALGNMDYEPAGGGPGVRLRDDTAAALVERFENETNPAVRMELAKSLALTQPDARTSEHLLGFLADGQIDVLKYGILGLSEAKLPAALPRLVALLKHRDRGVRLQVGQTLAAYGGASAPYLTEIESALDTEQDELVKQTLEGALSAVRKAAGRSK